MVAADAAFLDFYRDVCARAEKVTRHSHDAEDAAHEAVLAVLAMRRRNVIRSQAAYAVIVMRNYVKAEMKRSARMAVYAPRDLTHDFVQAPSHLQPTSSVQAKRIMLWLCKFRASLPDSGRRIYDGLCREATIRGAARHCGCSPKNVRQFRDGLQRRFSKFLSDHIPPQTLGDRGSHHSGHNSPGAPPRRSVPTSA